MFPEPRHAGAYDAMTVNERLYAALVLDQFDVAGPTLATGGRSLDAAKS